MFTFGFLNAEGGFDPLVLLLVALVLDAALGGAFSFLPHPVRLIGAMTAWFDAKLNREHRAQMDRALRGAFVVLVMVTLAGTVGYGVAWLTFHHDFGWAVELSLTFALLAQRQLYAAVQAVRRALKEQGVEPGREAVSHIVGRDTTQLDEHGVARAAIESLAENFSDGVVAPVFWYVLFGFPGLLVYKTVNTLDSMIGYRSEKYKAFGFAAARLDDILNIPPARLAGVMIMLASLFAPKASPWGAFKTMMRDAGKHKSWNAGWPEGAMAGALGLALAGPRRYAKEVVNDPWIGDGTARATYADIGRALYIYVAACLINALVVTVAAMVRFGM